jgi:hypothetical protein
VKIIRVIRKASERCSRSDRDGQWQIGSPENWCNGVQSGQMLGRDMVTERA